MAFQADSHGMEVEGLKDPADTNYVPSRPDTIADKFPWTEINVDRSKTQLVNTSKRLFKTSACIEGVNRTIIERHGNDVARSTTLVSYVPNKTFYPHKHDAGEDFLVIEGVWKDNLGRYPKYSYIRNYIGSEHMPSMGPEGCVIYVKLRQMSLGLVEPNHTGTGPHGPDSPGWVDQPDGSKIKVLYESKNEKVTVQQLPEGYKGKFVVPKKGKEIFVVDGGFTSELGTHDKWSWCRLVHASTPANPLNVTGVSEWTYLICKEDHLESDEVGIDVANRKPKDWKFTDMDDEQQKIELDCKQHRFPKDE